MSLPLPPWMLRETVSLTVIGLAWGVLAFGAVYPWGYWPLLAGVSILGVIGLVRVDDPPRRSLDRPLAAALGLVVAASLLQVVPVPRGVLQAISPAADRFLKSEDLRYAAETAEEATGSGTTVWHAVSIAPAATWRGVAFLGSLGLFLLGMARSLDGRAVRRLAPALTILAVVVAAVGLAQRASQSPNVYGFWKPTDAGAPFAPLINRNHFAGWMLLALPFGLADLFARLRHASRRVPPRQPFARALVTSTGAAQIVASALALVGMAVALLSTMSRSGILCFAGALVWFGWAVTRRRPAGRGRLVPIAGLLVFGIVACAWAGTDPVVQRFVSSGLGGNDRLERFGYALAIAREFPWTGTGLNAWSAAMLLHPVSNQTILFDFVHNDYLQLLAEGGVLVGVPALILAGVFVREVAARFREQADDRTGYWLRTGAVIALASIAVQETVDFSLRIPGVAVLFVLMAAIAVRPCSPHSVAAPSEAQGHAQA
jgi:O-antigen ligase